MRDYTVTLFTDAFARTKREDTFTLPELVRLIRRTDHASKQQLPWLKFATFGDLKTAKGSLRHDANLKAITGVEADYDGEQVSLHDAAEAIEEAGIAAIIYTSPSHTEDKPRWRVVCPFARAHPPNERDHMLARLNGILGGVVSTESWTQSQSYYYGSVNHNLDHHAEAFEGDHIDERDDLDDGAILPQHQRGNGELHHPWPHTRTGSDPPRALLSALQRKPRYDEDKSSTFYWLVVKLARLGHGLKEIEAFVKRSPMAARYRDGGRLTPEIERVIGNAIRDGELDLPGEDDDEDEELEIKLMESDMPISRKWLYGDFLMRGAASVIGGSPGEGKSSIAVTMILSVITGKTLLKEKINRKGDVLVIAYEDDMDEWNRRVQAACIHHGINFEKDIIPHLHFIARDWDKPKFIISQRGSDGAIEFPNSKRIVKHLQKGNYAMMLIDPLSHANLVEDTNSSSPMAQVVNELNRIAEVTDVSILVLHHLRKGANGGVEDLLGSTSLIATFRSARILRRLTPEKAKEMGIKDKEAWRYLNISSTKDNYAPSPGHGLWYQLVSIPLNNGTLQYPDGDNIGVIDAWDPDPPLAGLDIDSLEEIFDALRETPHALSKKTRSNPWIIDTLTNSEVVSEERAKSIMDHLIEEGVFKVISIRNKNDNAVKCIKLDEKKVEELLEKLRASQN